MVKKILKKFIPKSLLLQYHKTLACLAAFWYGYPARKMIVVGVTGTQGKSTVVNLIAKILENAGFKVGATSTINFKVADKEWINAQKMTMLGRFALQKLLNQMVKAGCQYAVIETSSEGIAQYRHLGIDYDVAVFTNLSPEHIESHGSFENYKKAKSKLFLKLENSQPKAGPPRAEKTKKLKNKIVEKVSIINLDDKYADYFLQFPADEHYGYAVNFKPETLNYKQDLKAVKAENVQLGPQGSRFTVYGLKFTLNLLGKFNVANALAAICVGLSQGIDLEIVKKGLEKIKSIPGRMEQIDKGQKFKVFVDYAHTPQALEAIYKTIGGSSIIHVLGSCGGGRDKAKRLISGKIAGQNAKYVIVTNEDPYDEDPNLIIDEVAKGAEAAGKKLNQDLFKILDRRQAIKKALDLAKADDIILITGKGSEQAICLANNKKIPWDDRKVVRELLEQKG
jgi:UDP-N-acetylmuramoyl-L-alanyl-D-glutamate--2,6-diaminopimelate ligase